MVRPQKGKIMTEKILDKIPVKVRGQIEVYRKDYNEAKRYDKRWIMNETMARASAYCKGLMDAGLITDRERQLLYIYTTV